MRQERHRTRHVQFALGDEIVACECDGGVWCNLGQVCWQWGVFGDAIGVEGWNPWGSDVRVDAKIPGHGRNCDGRDIDWCVGRLAW